MKLLRDLIITFIACPLMFLAMPFGFICRILQVGFHSGQEFAMNLCTQNK